MASTGCLLGAYLLHSPAFAADRLGHALLIRQRLLPCCLPGGEVFTVDSFEPADIAGDVARLVELDAAKVSDSTFLPHVRNLQLRQLSNSMKHLEALRRIAAAGGDGFALVVEDDVLFGDQLQDVLSRTVRDAPASTGMVFLGLPSASDHNEDAAVFDGACEIFPVLPACDSYLVRPSVAGRLAEAFLPVRFPTNVQLSYLLRTACTDVAPTICVPNAFVDGSKLGAFVCSLDANSKLLWNQACCRMELLVERTGGVPYGAEEDAEFAALLAAQQFKDHPNVLVLCAQHQERLGKHAEAASTYRAAIAAYDKTGALVNNTSVALRRLVAVHRHLQDA